MRLATTIALTYFNSIKVRLECTIGHDYSLYFLDFNSIKVRLESAVKRHLIAHILISIP